MESAAQHKGWTCTAVGCEEQGPESVLGMQVAGSDPAAELSQASMKGMQPTRSGARGWAYALMGCQVKIAASRLSKLGVE